MITSGILHDILCFNNKTFEDYANDPNFILLKPTTHAIINSLNNSNLEYKQFSQINNIGDILSNHIFVKSQWSISDNTTITAINGNTFTINGTSLQDNFKNIGTIVQTPNERFTIDIIINFPIKETIILDPYKVYDGYTLFTTMGSDSTHLINNEGNIVHQWLGTNAAMAFSKLITEGFRKGQLIRHLNNNSASNDNPKLNFGGVRGYIEILDWDSNIIWSHNLNGVMPITDSKYGTVNRHYVSHHDFCYNPVNDSIFVMIWVAYTKEESIDDGRPPSLFPNKDNPHILHEMIFEIEIETKNILWMWNSQDHIGKGPHKIDLTYYNNGDKEDILHANAIDYNDEKKELIISVRGYHEIWAISYITNQIVWRWGNTSTYSENGVRILDGQHNCQWITDGRDKGGILIFDNDQLAQKHSEIRTVFPVYNSDGSYKLFENKFQPEHPEHSIKINSKVGSWFISGCQRLPNENTLTCNGPYGTFIEFNTAGEEVWRYTSPIELFSKPWPPPPQLKSGEDDFIVFDDTKYRDSMTFRAVKYSSYLPIFSNLKPLGIKLSNYETHHNSLFQVIKKYYPFIFHLYEKHGLLNYLTNPHANCIMTVDENNFNLTSLAVVYKDGHVINICNNKNDLINLYEIKNILKHNIVHHQKQLIANNTYQSEAHGRYTLANQISMNESTITSFYNLQYDILNSFPCINGSVYNINKLLIPELNTTGTIKYDDNSNFYFTVTPGGSYNTLLLSKNNQVIKQWNSEFKSINRTSLYVYKGPLAKHLIRLEWSEENSLPNDNEYMSGGGYNTISIFDDDNNLKFRTQFPYSKDLYLHHDISVYEDTGSLWICANENLTFEEYNKYIGDLPYDQSKFAGIPILLEITPTLDGSNEFTINWQLNFKDLLNDGSLIMLNHKYNKFNTNDFYHINKVVRNNNTIVVSCRTTSEIIAFSYLNKSILWKFCEPTICLGNHDPTFIDDNTLSIFNNGYGNPNSTIPQIQTSLLILDINSQSIIKTILFPQDMKSNFASGATLLNDKIVACFTSRGCIAEFDMNGNNNWLFINPYTDTGKTILHSVELTQNDNRLHNVCVIPTNVFNIDSTQSVFDVTNSSGSSNDY